MASVFDRIVPYTGVVRWDFYQSPAGPCDSLWGTAPALSTPAAEIRFVEAVAALPYPFPTPPPKIPVPPLGTHSTPFAKRLRAPRPFRTPTALVAWSYYPELAREDEFPVYRITKAAAGKPAFRWTVVGGGDTLRVGLVAYAPDRSEAFALPPVPPADAVLAVSGAELAAAIKDLC